MVTPRITATNPLPGGKDTVVENTCIGCRDVHRAKVKTEDVTKWQKGAFVQDAFPYLSADDREVLFISAICPTCWDEMYGEEE